MNSILLLVQRYDDDRRDYDRRGDRKDRHRSRDEYDDRRRHRDDYDDRHRLVPWSPPLASALICAQ